MNSQLNKLGRNTELLESTKDFFFKKKSCTTHKNVVMWGEGWATAQASKDGIGRAC
jgi:hypothetical protein